MNKKKPHNMTASYLILMKDNKVLLQRRYNTGYNDGKYGIPSGHVEKNETFTQTLIREVKEEIGITLKTDDVNIVHIMHRKSEEKVEWVDAFFITNKQQDEVKNMEPNKCDDLSWFPIDNLPDNTIDYIRFVFEQIKDKKFYSEYGW